MADVVNMRLAESVELPSQGKIYDENIPEEVILSSMRMKHEMMRLSANDAASKIMAEIIDDCSNIDVISSYDLCIGDFQYLLYRLRMVTYGPEYEMYTQCPLCGFEHKTNANMDEFDVRVFDDELVGLLDLTLPDSGMKIKLTLQTPKMLDVINRKAKDYMRKHPGAVNPTLLYSIADSIIEIDDEPIINRVKLEKMVEDLSMRDTNALINRIDKINGYMGVDARVEVTCPICGKEYVVPFRVGPEFWRPEE